MSEPFFETAWGNIVIFVAVALILNICWYFFGWNMHGDSYMYRHNRLIPAGWIIAIVWMVLFGFFGYAHFLVLKANEGKASLASIAIIVAAAWCILYPLLTYLFGKGYTRMVNLLSLLVVFALCVIVVRESELALYYLLPLAVWVAYVNFADSVYCTEHICEEMNSKSQKIMVEEVIIVSESNTKAMPDEIPVATALMVEAFIPAGPADKMSVPSSPKHKAPRGRPRSPKRS